MAVRSSDRAGLKQKARSQMLQGEVDRNREQIEEMTKGRKALEKLVREFCEEVLCKDRNAVNASDRGAKLWSRMTTEELIRAAQDSFGNQCRENRELNSKLVSKNGELMDQLDIKDQDIQSLKDQIMRGGAVDSQEDLEARLESDRQEKETDAKKKTLSATFRSSPTSVAFVEGNDDDIDMEDPFSLYSELENDSESAILVPVEKKIPSTAGKGEIAQKKEREKAARLLHAEDLRPIIDGLTDPELFLMGVVGKTGKARYQEIIADDKAAQNFANGALFGSAKNLVSKGIFEQEKFYTPIWKNNTFYQFSPKGQRIYAARFGEEPEESEMKRIKAEHTTYEHGYGIKSFAGELRKNKEFKIVDEFTRKKGVKIADGIFYIPDIICRTSQGKTYYIEYETGKTPQAEFNSKLSKMVQVTDMISIATPDHESAKHIQDQVDKWIRNRGEKSLDGVIVRVSPVLQLTTAGRGIIPSDNWMYRKKIGTDKEWSTNN